MKYIYLKQTTTDLLLTYLLHPGTVGCTNRFQNLTLDPLNPTQLIFAGPPWYQTDQLLFIKLSFLLRF